MKSARRIIPLMFLAAVVVALPLSSQVTIGLAAGMVSSRIHATGTAQSATSSARTGIAAGLTFLHPVGERLRLATAVLYVQKGNEDGNDDFRYPYFEVPLVLQYDLETRRLFQPFVGVGASVGLNLRCGVVTNSKSQPCDAVDAPGVKRGEFGLVGEAGFRIDRVSVRVRYDYGLSQVYAANTAGASGRNRAFLFLAGVTY